MKLNCNYTMNLKHLSTLNIKINKEINFLYLWLHGFTEAEGEVLVFTSPAL